VSTQIERGAIHSNGAAAPLLPEKTDEFSSGSQLSKIGRRYFEPGTYARDGSFVFVRNPTEEQLCETYDVLKNALGWIAALPVVKSVYARNPLAWWVLWRAEDASRHGARIAGVAAYVPLNEAGLAAVRCGKFNGRDPDLDFVAARNEEPAGLYLWGLVAHGLSDLAGKLVGHVIGLDLYETLPMIGTIGTEEGLAALRRSSKSATDAAKLMIGSTFEIKLPPKHIEHQRQMPVWEGANSTCSSA
jgi:hypothetical protein